MDDGDSRLVGRVSEAQPTVPIPPVSTIIRHVVQNSTHRLCPLTGMADYAFGFNPPYVLIDESNQSGRFNAATGTPVPRVSLRLSISFR